MNRICKKCNIEKTLSEFPKHTACKLGREYRCKECKKDNDKKLLKKRKRPGYVKRTAILKLLKSKGCQNCQEDNPICLDFHHTQPSKKEFGISIILNGEKTDSQYIEELQKCAILCSNCHRKLHGGSLSIDPITLTYEEIVESINTVYEYDYVL